MHKRNKPLLPEAQAALDASLIKLESHYHSSSGHARVHVVRAKPKHPLDIYRSTGFTPEDMAIYEQYRGADQD